jgi:hypothetical protein
MVVWRHWIKPHHDREELPRSRRPKSRKWSGRQRRRNPATPHTGARAAWPKLTAQRLRRSIFRDVEELVTAIGDYIDKYNDSPKPFVWTAKASDILEKVKRARAVLDSR